MTSRLEMSLGRRSVKTGGRPYLIAEIGVNHEGDIDLARRLIDLAKKGGADAAKFQTYKSDQLAAKKSPAYWDLNAEPTTSQRELFARYDSFGEREYTALAGHCEDAGITFLSTAFDHGAVEFLDPLMPFHKVASADITNFPLLRLVASKKKPVVLSTGASSLAEIAMAVAELEAAGCDDIVLLQCTLNYPCPDENAHLNMIDSLSVTFPHCMVGYSDHTLPDEAMTILTAAWIKGASVIEKHFTHDKSLHGNDHYHAMDVADCQRFCSNVDKIEAALGNFHKEALPEEAPARLHARRSITTARALSAGERLDEASLTCKRPAHGISPIHWNEVIGRTVVCNISDDEPLQWRHLADE